MYIIVFSTSEPLQVLWPVHQDCGLCYLHLPIFFSYTFTVILCWKVFAIAVFLSKLDHRPLFNDIY